MDIPGGIEPMTRAERWKSFGPLIGLGWHDDQASRGLHQAQTFEVLRLLPTSTLSLVACSALTVFMMYGHVGLAEPGAWFVMMFGYALHRRKSALSAVGDSRLLASWARAPGSLAIRSAISSLLFMVPLLYWAPSVPFNTRVMYCVLLTGIMSGGSVSLSTVPIAAFAYLWTLAGGLMWLYFQMDMGPMVGITLV